jgi:hypothetical protein
MSASSEKQWWLDRWWPLLLIVFGVSCVSLLVFFKPHF